MSYSELEALISLLDDPDAKIYSEVKSKLISFGDEVIPHLENAWEASFDHLLQDRIEDIVHFLQFDSVKRNLTTWKNDKTHNLIDAAIIVAEHQYADINKEEITDFIDKVTQEVWLEMNDNLTALEKVKVLNHIIFEVYGFHGNKKNINSPQNSYINNVIETKIGNPITLSIVYLAICQKLNIPIYGVDVPQHFVLAYAEEFNEVLFYMNVFNRGFVFNKYDIDKFLAQLNLTPEEQFYTPCSNLAIIRRLVQHLIYTYDHLGYLDKKAELYELLNILK